MSSPQSVNDPIFANRGEPRVCAEEGIADWRVIQACFERLFAETERTRLMGGADEPLYLPAEREDGYHTIFFTRDYTASALHELAHWCLAGAARRQRVDYGYWYAPDGRSAEQQSEFERVEVKPQAIEWHLTMACQRRFRLSADNLEGGCEPSPAFVAAVVAQARSYARDGLPPRAARLRAALSSSFGGPSAPPESVFTHSELGQ